MPGEGVGVDLDVGVDEHDHVAGGPRDAGVAGAGGRQRRRAVDHDDLVGRVVGRRDRGAGTAPAWGAVGRRDDDGQVDHRAGL